MKKAFLILMVIVMGLSGCSWRPRVTAVHPPVKRITLPERVDGKPPESYVVNGVRYYPLPDADGFVETGKASWYGEPFHGRTTSNGEVYNMHGPTAAHTTLPFGTYVSVRNLANGKSTVVRINDRGPFVKGRIIDLSYGAAKEIGLVGPGVTDVRITALAPQVATGKTPGGGVGPVVETRDFKTGEFTVQIGAFLNRESATGLAERLSVIFDHVKVTEFVDENERTLHRVRVSRTHSLKDAGEIEKKLKELGFTGAFVVRI